LAKATEEVVKRLLIDGEGEMLLADRAYDSNRLREEGEASWPSAEHPGSGCLLRQPFKRWRGS
jgi:hypothetical protein